MKMYDSHVGAFDPKSRPRGSEPTEFSRSVNSVVASETPRHGFLLLLSPRTRPSRRNTQWRDTERGKEHVAHRVPSRHRARSFAVASTVVRARRGYGAPLFASDGFFILFFKHAIGISHKESKKEKVLDIEERREERKGGVGVYIYI